MTIAALAVSALLLQAPIAIQGAVDVTTDLLEKRIIDATPRDRADAAKGWRQRQGSGLSRELVNTEDHINVLE